MKTLIDGEVKEWLIKVYLWNAPEMVRFLNQNFGIKFQVVKNCPDYFPDKLGSKWYKNMLVMNRKLMSQIERYTWLRCT